MNYNENLTMIYIMFVLVGIPLLFFILIVLAIPWIIKQLTYEVYTYNSA